MRCLSHFHMPWTNAQECAVELAVIGTQYVPTGIFLKPMPRNWWLWEWGEVYTWKIPFKTSQLLDITSWMIRGKCPIAIFAGSGRNLLHITGVAGWNDRFLTQQFRGQFWAISYYRAKLFLSNIKQIQCRVHILCSQLHIFWGAGSGKSFIGSHVQKGWNVLPGADPISSSFSNEFMAFIYFLAFKTSFYWEISDSYIIQVQSCRVE